jgi:MYXO-CTERM domain-containing protein
MRAVLACALLAALCSIAESNGRPPATSSINFEQGDSQHVVAGMTFGVLFSSDGGATWTWMCEATFPYSGMFDPVYAYKQSGTIFATTFSGLKAMRDGCTWNLTSAGSDYMSNVIGGSGSALVATASAPMDSTIYASPDDGQTWAPHAMPGLPDDYWQSYVIAPSNPSRVYLAGYRFVKECDENSANQGSACNVNANCTASGSATAKCSTTKSFLLFRSDDGGSNFSPISQANLTLSQSSAISVAGVDPTNADAVYIHVNLETDAGGDGVYKSFDGGGSGSADGSAWTKILDTQDQTGLVVLVRSNGGLVAATETMGAMSSPGGSACTNTTTCAWTPLAGAPHINCLAEDPTSKAVWACTQNYGNGSNIPSDGAGIMKTADLATWTPVLKFSDIAGPVMCGSDTVQAQQCVAPYMGMPSVWCCLVQQLGITSTAVDCTGANACQMGADDPAPVMTKPGGCCNTGGGGPGALLLGVITGLFVYRRRRR